MAIFKKHGILVGSVVAVSTVIGVVISKLQSIGKTAESSAKKLDDEAKKLDDEAKKADDDVKKLDKKVDGAVAKLTTTLVAGFKGLGKKIAAILPGLVGAIASFVFSVAGKAISFLGEHTWLLVLAMTAFLVERTLKSRRQR